LTTFILGFLKNPGRFNQRSGPFTVFLGRLHFNSGFNEKKVVFVSPTGCKRVSVDIQRL
jgi:hypothetical protein